MKIDRFGYFYRVRFCTSDPSVNPVDSDFYHGIADSTYRSGTTTHLIKNTWSLPQLMIVDANLVVAREIKDRLNAIVRADFVPVSITRAFRYPFEPGDTRYQQDPCYIDDSSNVSREIVLRFAEKYKCKPPSSPEYFAVSMASFGDRVLALYDDVRSFTVGGNAQILRQDVRVSKRLLEVCGIGFSMGFVCTLDCYKVLQPYLQSPYLWSTILSWK